MKYKMDKYTQQRVLGGIAIAAFAVGAYFLLMNFNLVRQNISHFMAALFPFIVGFIIAFLLNPLTVFLEKKVLKPFPLKAATKRTIGAIIAVLLGMTIVIFVLGMISIQIKESIEALMKNYNTYYNSLEEKVLEFSQLLKLSEPITQILTELSNQFMTFLKSISLEVLNNVLTVSVNVISTLFKILIGIVAGLYMLIDKATFMRHINKLSDAFFSDRVSAYLRRFLQNVKRIFYGFLVGRALDSLILGIITFAFTMIFRFPYAGLISLIITITNIIPVFGPFIGAVPSILLLLLVSPIHALYFMIFIIVLQQFDGNYLGPKLIGDKLGLPSFWILFSVTVGGALFGIMGMLIGVPVFAVFYFLTKEIVEYRLDKKAAHKAQPHLDTPPVAEGTDEA